MTPDRIRQVASVLEMALELDEETRGLYLDTLAVQDPELAAAVRSNLPAEIPAEGEVLEREELSNATATEVDAETVTEREGPEPQENPLALPKRIGPYRIDGWLGAGGMGAVYSAIRDDQEFERRVAIKVLQLRFPTEEMVRRFRGERQILAGFDHPNIAKLYEGGATDEGLPYLVMELVDGSPLTDYCDDHGLSVADRVGLFRKVCAAVQYAHSRLVVHRDLKPTNVLVTTEGEPKLLDFGIAKLLDPEAFPLTVQATMTGPGPFTPRYASPEQLRGEAITTASDVYSLGVLLYLALTGTWPYRPSSSWPSAILEHMSTHDPPLLSRAVLTQDPDTVISAERRFGSEPLMVSRELKGDLDNIVAKAIEVDPDRRYKSVEQLDDDLRRYLEGAPVLARQGTALYRAGKFVRRHRAGVGAALGFVGMSGSFALAMSRQAARVARERNAALEARDLAEQAQLVAEQSSRAEQEVSRVLVELFESEDPQNRDPNVSALSLVRKGIARIQEHDSLALPTRVKLLGTLGLVLRNLGEYPQSVEVLRQAANLGGGEPIAEKAEVYLNLGRVYESIADFAAASEALERAEELVDPGDVSNVTAILNLQGIVAYYDGSMAKAVGCYRQAQRISEAALGPLHPDALTPRINAAGLESTLGNIEASIRELFEVLDHTRHSSLGMHALALQTLAGVLSYGGYIVASLAVMAWALEANRILFGPHHKRYLRLLLTHFQNLVRSGGFEQAQKIFDSIDVGSIPEHLRGALQGEMQIRLGDLALNQGDFAEAASRLEVIFDDIELLTPLILDRCGFMAMAIWALIESGRLDQVEDRLMILSENVNQGFGEVDLESLALATRGRWHEVSNELEAAETCYEEALGKSSPMVNRGYLLGFASKRLCMLLRARGREDLALVEEERRAASLSPRIPMDFPKWLFQEPNFESSADSGEA